MDTKPKDISKLNPFELRLLDETTSPDHGTDVRTYISQIAIMESLGHDTEYAKHINALTNKKSEEGRRLEGVISKLKEEHTRETAPAPIKGIVRTSRLKNKIARDIAMQDRLRRVHGTETDGVRKILFKYEDGMVLKNKGELKQAVKKLPRIEDEVPVGRSRYENAGLMSMGKEKRKQQRSAERIRNRMAGMSRMERRARALKAWAGRTTQDEIYGEQSGRAPNPLRAQNPDSDRGDEPPEPPTPDGTSDGGGPGAPRGGESPPETPRRQGPRRTRNPRPPRSPRNGEVE